MAQAEISVENATNRSESQEDEMAVTSRKMVAILIFVQFLVYFLSDSYSDFCPNGVIS